MEKTDLRRIIAISGEHGLFNYLAQGKSGMIAESLETGKRSTFGAHSKVSALGDISIYTMDSELSLKDVFRKMSEVLGGKEAISSKSSNAEILAFFDKAIPDYDGDRFYVSHMKKVLDWYNCLQKYASLDFVDEEEEEPKTE